MVIVTFTHSVVVEHRTDRGTVERAALVGYDLDLHHYLTAEGGRIGRDHVFIRHFSELTDAINAGTLPPTPDCYGCRGTGFIDWAGVDPATPCPCTSPNLDTGWETP